MKYLWCSGQRLHSAVRMYSPDSSDIKIRVSSIRTVQVMVNLDYIVTVVVINNLLFCGGVTFISTLTKGRM